MLKLKSGDIIEYLDTVNSPASQEGKIGQTKTVDREISIYSANYLLRGNVVRMFNPDSPLKIKTEKTKKTKTERSKTDGQGPEKKH